MASRKDHDATRTNKPVDTGDDEEGTNLIKRLTDNQPLSDTHKVHDKHRGEHRQYGMRDADPAPGGNEPPGPPPATRGSDG